jgi:oxygen-independent coproporphyrinogen-3 oxidase
VQRGKAYWTRSANHRSTTQYIRLVKNGRNPVAEADSLDLEQWIRERLVFGLRQMEGVDLADLSTRWGGQVQSLFEPHLSRYIEMGWLDLKDQRVRLTLSGLVISDSLWPDLLGPH